MFNYPDKKSRSSTSEWSCKRSISTWIRLIEVFTTLYQRKHNVSKMNNITGVLESNPEIVFLFTGLLFQEFSTILLNFHWNLSYFFAWAAIFSSIRVPRCFQQRLIFAFQNQIRLRKKLKNSKHHNTRESQLNVGPTNIGPASIDLPPGFVYFCFRSSKVSTPTFSSNYVNTIKKKEFLAFFLFIRLLSVIFYMLQPS